MMSLVNQKFKNIKSIHLSFLERGHTQNENDSVHSFIQGRKKCVSIYHPYQWTILIARKYMKIKAIRCAFNGTGGIYNIESVRRGNYRFKSEKEN